VVANAVNVAHAGIARRPACDVKDDSDLGALLVTVAVPRLPETLVREALAAGRLRARELQGAGLIWSATLTCQGQWATTVPIRPVKPHASRAEQTAFATPPQPTGSVFA